MRLFATVLLLAGCYRPSIADNSFTCGDDGQCPSGFTCNAERLCAKKGGSSGGNGLYSGILGDQDLTGMMGSVTASTKTGEILYTDANGAQTIVVPAGAAGFARLQQTSGPLLGAWSFGNLTIPAGVTVKPSSDSDAQAIFATSGTLDVEGGFDWRGFGGFGGISDGGGREQSSGVLSGGGPGVDGTGGGGGGHAFVGDSAVGVGGGIGGMMYGSDDLAILHAGSGGGGGGSSSTATGAEGGLGGGGGGALALLSAMTITIGGTADVSGDAGGQASGNGGGGGGGSGGSLLISAPTISINTGYTLAATGGTGGSGAGAGGMGGNGSVGRILLAGTLGGSVTAVVSSPMYLSNPTPDNSFPVGATSAP